jgi:ABC-2 type transport system permease protein
MFFYLVTSLVVARLYRVSYSRVQTGMARRARYGGSRAGRWFHFVFAFLPASTRLLILKDLRSFRRDPVQWSQFLIYVGLLGLYFFMYPRVGGQFPGYPRYAISFLNLSVAALILSTFTTRFVFPLLSLEGRKFWILGLLPMRRENILWSKFAFAAGGALLPTAGLVCLSDWALEVQPGLLAVHLATVVLLCSGLAGISVGLGARLPNLREENPSKIAAGFGGTLNLVISTLFIFAMLLLLALPAQLYFASLEMERSIPVRIGSWRAWLVLSMAAGTVLAAVATIVPMRNGAKAFRELEV